MVGMDRTPQLLDAWLEKSQPLLDEGRDLHERVEAGCVLVRHAALGDDVARLTAGTVPAGLPGALHDPWKTAFDEDRADDERLLALMYLYGTFTPAELNRAALERQVP
jgi:hypothetical protein